jgi:hypothetical protein
MTLAKIHQQSRLEQACPSCGMREAAGAYCTACLTATGVPYWRRAVRSEAQKAASGTSGHLRVERGSSAKKTAIPGPLA